MKVLTRYLLRSHISPLLFAFVALTGIILINTLAKELASLAGKGLPMSVVLEFFLLSLPANIALTLPMAVLVAVLYTFANFAADNEVTALRASGDDLRRAALPVIVAGALVAGTMVWFSDQVLPSANYRWRVLMTDVAGARPLLALREQTINPIRTAEGLTPYFIEAQQIDVESGFMREVAIYDVSDSRVTRTINADSGRMAFNPSRTDLLLTLFDGDVREVDFNDMSSFQVIAFREQMMRMVGVSDRLERTGESAFRTDRDMTLGMMQARIDTLRFELTHLRGGSADTGAAADSVSGSVAEQVPDTTQAAIIARADGSGARGGPPSGPSTSPLQETIDAEAERYIEARTSSIEGQIREFQVEIQKKFSIAAASLVFVLLGIPIALRFPGGGIGMVIGVSLAIFGVYYVGLIAGETLGDAGYVPPVVAMWATNAVFGIVGLIGFLRLGYEQGSGRGGGWGELPGWLKLPGGARRRDEASE